MEKPRTIWHCTIWLLLAVGLYPLSFGPACWLEHRGWIDRNSLATLYQPLLVVAHEHPHDLQKAVLWYAALGAKPNYAPLIGRFAHPFPGRLVTGKLLVAWEWTGPMLQ